VDLSFGFKGFLESSTCTGFRSARFVSVPEGCCSRPPVRFVPVDLAQRKQERSRGVPIGNSLSAKLSPDFKVPKGHSVEVVCLPSFVERAGLIREPTFGRCGVTERSPGVVLGLRRCREQAKSLSRYLPVRFVSKCQIHMHHESVSIRRILDQISAGFWPELDGCESHRRNFSPFVDLDCATVRLGLRTLRVPRSSAKQRARQPAIAQSSFLSCLPCVLRTSLMATNVSTARIVSPSIIALLQIPCSA
jgi:hypothetical protein